MAIFSKGGGQFDRLESGVQISKIDATFDKLLGSSTVGWEIVDVEGTPNHSRVWQRLAEVSLDTGDTFSLAQVSWSQSNELSSPYLDPVRQIWTIEDQRGKGHAQMFEARTPKPIANRFLPHHPIPSLPKTRLLVEKERGGRLLDGSKEDLIFFGQTIDYLYYCAVKYINEVKII